MSLTIKIIIGVFIATIIGLVTMQFIAPSQQIIESISKSFDSDDTTTIKVSIEGEVEAEGSYIIDEGSTLDDLISIANGLTDNADTLCFFTDLELENNETYYIAPIYDIDDVCGNTKLIKWNINTCTKDDLKNIDGIGDSIAQSIITHRAEHGSFYRLEDVMDVNGIGNATFSKLKNYIRLKEAN